jgi:hypothetical protein
VKNFKLECLTDNRVNSVHVYNTVTLSRGILTVKSDNTRYNTDNRVNSVHVYNTVTLSRDILTVV